MSKIQIRRREDGHFFRCEYFQLPGMDGTFCHRYLLVDGVEHEFLAVYGCEFLCELRCTEKATPDSQGPRRFACLKSLDDSGCLDVYECESFPTCFRDCEYFHKLAKAMQSPEITSLKEAKAVRETLTFNELRNAPFKITE